MFISADLKKTIIISTIGHLSIFGVFNFTFGQKPPNLNYASVSFLGQLFPKVQISQFPLFEKKTSIFFKKTDTRILDKIKLDPSLSSEYFLKPAIPLSFCAQKQVFVDTSAPALPYLSRKEPRIVFHPFLPYSFPLYFKDRQTAHVELKFNIFSDSLKSSIEIRRKVSSGNLEVDLLSVRYIGRYLFLQKARFLQNSWQTVRIDLSQSDK